MKIETKRTTSLIGVKIVDGGTTVDLGLLNDDERDELARELVEAVWAIGPNSHDNCSKWLADILSESGIKLPQQ